MCCSPRGGLLIRKGIDIDTAQTKKEQDGNI